jgi:hypothetical protein
MKKTINPELFNDLKLLPEERFILDCLRAELDGDHKLERLTGVDIHTIDWNAVYEKAMRWGIAPFLIQIFKKQNPFLEIPHIPASFRHNIIFTYLQTFSSNKRNFDKLYEILRVFHAAGIDVVLLKGSHLAQFVYQDIGFRTMCDLDILIRKEHLDKAEKLILKMGYEYIKQHDDTQKQAAIIAWWKNPKSGHYHLAPFSCPTKGIKNLEIHWGIEELGSPFNKDIEGLWERSKPVQTSGMDVLVLSPEDLLLHLSIHLAYHHQLKFFGLRSCCDIAAIINHYADEVDWHQLQTRALNWGGGKYLYLALHLSKEILRAKIPDEILCALKPDYLPEEIMNEAKKCIFCLEQPDSVDSQKLNKIILIKKFIFTRDINIFRKIYFIFKKIFVSKEEMAIRYSLSATSRRIYFYYPCRFFSLLVSYALAFVTFFIGRLIRKENTQARNLNLAFWLSLSASERNLDR